MQQGLGVKNSYVVVAGFVYVFTTLMPAIYTLQGVPKVCSSTLYVFNLFDLVSKSFKQKLCFSIQFNIFILVVQSLDSNI